MLHPPPPTSSLVLNASNARALVSSHTASNSFALSERLYYLARFYKLGQLMEALLSQVQLYSGYGTMSILETCKIPIEYVPDSWIMHLRTFLATMDGKIHIPNVWLPPRRRENDSFIMEEVNLLPLSTPNKRRVNDCRLYLGAITKSDLVTADGTELDMRLLEGRRRLATTLIFPDRPSPPATSWKIFRSTMRRLYAKHRKGKMPKRLRLEFPMGPWYQIQHHAWDRWMLDEGKNVLYEYDETKRCLNVLKYSPDQQGYSRTGASTKKMPKLAVPVQTVESNVVKLIGHRPSLPLPHVRDAETAEMSLKERIACQPDHIRRMIGDVEPALIQDLQTTRIPRSPPCNERTMDRTSRTSNQASTWHIGCARRTPDYTLLFSTIDSNRQLMT